MYRFKPTLAAAFMLAASSAATSAQETEGGFTILDPISIFATLSPIAAFDYPGQVNVIEREEIERSQASSIGDVLQNTPGVLVDGGARRAGQQPTIRGFREEDIVILIDGVRQNFLSVHDGRVFIEPDLLKTVEVVKGPISSLYGSGALGGIIALTTVDASDFLAPGETQGVRLKTGYSSATEEVLATTTAFARSETGNLEVLGSFVYRNNNDIKLGEGARFGTTTFKELPNEEDIRSGLFKIKAEVAKDLSLTGTWITYNNDGKNANNPQGIAIPNANNRLVGRDVDSDNLSGKLSWNPADNPLIDGNLLAYWARNRNSEDESVDPVNPRNRILSREVETVGISIDNRSRVRLSDTAKVTFTYGAEYYVDEQTGEDNNILGGGLNPVADAEAAYGGAFVQAELNLTRPLGLPGELTFLPSIRFDTFDLTYKDDDPNLRDFSDQAISKKLGVAYKPADWLLLFGNYGEAFRAPSFTEFYAQGNHFPGGLFFPPFGPPQLRYNIFIPNPNLRPQEGVSLEGGLGFDFKNVVMQGDRLKIKGSYWTTDATDFIDGIVEDSGCSFAPFPPFNQATCFSTFINRDAELDGVEIEVKYDSYRFFAGFAYETIDGRDKDTGAFLGSLYPDRYIFDLGVKLPEYWSLMGARLTLADDFTKVNSPTQVIDGYTTLDLYASFEPLEGHLKGLRVDVGIDNVTDEAYARGAPTNFQPGRDYKAAVGWTTKW